jgi:flagellar protein FlaI
MAELIEKSGGKCFSLNLDEFVASKGRKVQVLVRGNNYRIVQVDGRMPQYVLSIPSLSNRDKRIFKDIKDRAINEIDVDPESIPDIQKRREIFLEEVTSLMETYYANLSPGKRGSLCELIVRDMIGLGILEHLLEDDDLEDIMVLGVNKSIYVYHRKYGMCKTNIAFEDSQMIISAINKIASSIGRRIDMSAPLLDARLPDGSRLNATLSPVSLHGPTMTIRKFKKDPITVVDLLRFNTLTPEVAAYLWLLVEGMGVKPGNILVAGGSSSGKSTTLNCLSSFIPPNERVVTIEDTAELRLPIEHIISLETRLPNVEGKGEITMDDLVKNALRMRPDRIIVGEVRGSEARTMFTAMNTGHDGCMGTVHANSARETIARLTNPPMTVAPVMLSAIDAIIIQDRIHSGNRVMRRITELAEVINLGRGRIKLQNLYEWNPRKDILDKTGKSSVVKKELARLKGTVLEDIEIELKKREEVLIWMLNNGITHLDDVGKVFEAYYTNPGGLMEKIITK